VASASELVREPGLGRPRLGRRPDQIEGAFGGHDPSHQCNEDERRWTLDKREAEDNGARAEAQQYHPVDAPRGGPDHRHRQKVRG
jgi:hypothetical protein